MDPQIVRNTEELSSSTDSKAIEAEKCGEGTTESLEVTKESDEVASSDMKETPKDDPEINRVEELSKKRGIPALITNDSEDEEAAEDDDKKKESQGASNIVADKGEEDDGPKLLDLAFAMDCTGSMGSYIHQAQQNIRRIVEEVVSKEQADVRMGLVEYRDHPPQESTFVTRVHDFTTSVREMKKWLDVCSASGGGDGPEAVADALHQVLKLSWRQEATKICVFISDAPPHGLGIDSGDGFPKGCPAGLDPMVTAGQLAERSITIYLVGCEPSINRYKEFFTAIAHITGGQYVPLTKASLLTAVITGGAQEELSLQSLMDEVNEEVQQELAGAKDGSVEYEELSKKIHSKMKSRGHMTTQLQLNSFNLPQASVQAQMLSYCSNMGDIRKKIAPADSRSYGSHSMGAPSKGRSKRSKRKSAGPVTSDGASADASATDSGSGGGWMDGIKSWFGGGKKSDSPGGAPGSSTDEHVYAEPESAPARGSSEDIYEVTHKEIAEEQVYRMVSKSLATNKLRSKTVAKKE